MLAKEHRLPLRFYRDQTNQIGNLSSGSLFSFVIAQPPERAQLPTRFSVIVSKKISKQAVDRNRLRRQLLHQLARSLPDIFPGFDVIVLVKPSLLNSPASFIQTEMNKLLSRSHLSRL